VVRVGKFTGTTAIKKKGSQTQGGSVTDKFRVCDNYLRDDKKRTTDHHVKEMVDSMSQKNVEVYNENR